MEAAEVTEEAEAASDRSMERDDVASVSREQLSESAGLSLAFAEDEEDEDDEDDGEGDILSPPFQGLETLSLSPLHSSPSRNSSGIDRTVLPASYVRFPSLQSEPLGTDRVPEVRLEAA